MPSVVLPIYLDQPGSACIIPLIDFASPGEIQGLGAAPTLAALPGRRLGSLSTHVDARLSVGLFGMAGLDGSTDWNTQSFEWVGFGMQQSAAGTGQVGYSVEWGYGYRFHLQASASEFGANVTAQALAFKTRIKGLQTSFAAETFGVRSYKIYDALPTPDGYDQNTCAVFERLASASVDHAIHQGDVTPVPLGVTFDGDIAHLAVKKALSVRFAAQCIAARVDLAAASSGANARNLLTAEVERVYAAWHGGGAAVSNAAMNLAQRWLHIDGSIFHPAAGQREIDGLLVSPDVASAPLAGAADALGVRRLIVRSQLMDLTTSTTAGYGLASGGLSGDVRRLVFEIYTREGPITQTVLNGVARQNANISGLIRVNCLTAGVHAELQASFSGISADAALHQKTASFNFIGHGYSDALDDVFLVGNTDANKAPDRLAQVKNALSLLADANNHQPKQLPDSIVIQGGAEERPAGFPGARAIIRALEGVRDGDTLDHTRDRLKKIQLEPSAADAIAAIYTQADATALLEG